MILITGPTGNSGRELLNLLRQSDANVVCMSRREEARRKLEDMGWQTRHGDFDDPESLVEALEGVWRAYLVCTPDEQLQEREIRFIDTATREGVKKIVLLSALPCDGADSPILSAHASVERHLEESGLDFTILRPLGFMQTIFWMSLPSIQQKGEIIGATGEGKNAHIDLRDVAAVAHKSLTEDGHSRKIYDLTGPEALTMSEVARILTRHLDKEIRYVDVPSDRFEESMRSMGVPDFAVRHILGIFGEIRKGNQAYTLTTLEDLGIEPHTWRDFASGLTSGQTGIATSFPPPRS